jgi:hypothetical protein
MSILNSTDWYRHLQFGLGRLLVLPVLLALFFAIERQCGYISATIVLSSLTICALAYRLTRLKCYLAMCHLTQIMFAMSLWFALVDKETCSYLCPKCLCVWHITSYRIVGIPITTAYRLYDVTGKSLDRFPACPRNSLVLGRERRWWGLLIETDAIFSKGRGSIPVPPYRQPCRENAFYKKARIDAGNESQRENGDIRVFDMTYHGSSLVNRTSFQSATRRTSI